MPDGMPTELTVLVAVADAMIRHRSSSAWWEFESHPGHAQNPHVLRPAHPRSPPARAKLQTLLLGEPRHRADRSAGKIFRKSSGSPCLGTSRRSSACSRILRIAARAEQPGSDALRLEAGPGRLPGRTRTDPGALRVSGLQRHGQRCRKPRASRPGPPRPLDTGRSYLGHRDVRRKSPTPGGRILAVRHSETQ